MTRSLTLTAAIGAGTLTMAFLTPNGYGTTSPDVGRVLRPIAAPAQPTYQGKTAEQWLPIAEDLHPETRTEGMRAIAALATADASLIPYVVRRALSDPVNGSRVVAAQAVRALAVTQPEALLEYTDRLIRLIDPSAVGDVQPPTVTEAVAVTVGLLPASGNVAAFALSTLVQLARDYPERINPRLYPILIAHLHDGEGRGEPAAKQALIHARSLVREQGESALPLLREGLATPHPDIWLDVLKDLVEHDPQFGSAEAAGWLLYVLNDPDPLTPSDYPPLSGDRREGLRKKIGLDVRQYLASNPPTLPSWARTLEPDDLAEVLQAAARRHALMTAQEAAERQALQDAHQAARHAATQEVTGRR